MKRFILLLSVIGVLFIVTPNVVDAALTQKSSTNTSLYGNIIVKESDGWESKTDGSKYITQEYYVSKTFGDYIYIRLLETYNVKITNVLAASGFTIVKQVSVSGGVDVLLKASSSVSKSTQILTVTADIVDSSSTTCNLSYSPLSPNCLKLDGVYINASGKAISEEEYNEVCGEPTTTTSGSLSGDEKNPDTGSVVPYLAIGGGLCAIALVYFISRRNNKVYKI